jgi:hypothetical protein
MQAELVTVILDKIMIENNVLQIQDTKDILCIPNQNAPELFMLSIEIYILQFMRICVVCAENNF